MMYEHEMPGHSHVGYEYREITVPRELSSLCLDSYPYFGWEIDPNHEISARSGSGLRRSLSGAASQKERVTLYFRRNRSLCCKAELTRLQRNFDSCIAELQALEKSKTAASTIAALAAGMAGTAFMAGFTFAVTADPPILWLTIVLAIPGLIGWVVPYFLYRAVLRKKTAEIAPLKKQKYDEMDQLCEKGSRLLH